MLLEWLRRSTPKVRVSVIGSMVCVVSFHAWNGRSSGCGTIWNDRLSGGRQDVFFASISAVFLLFVELRRGYSAPPKGGLMNTPATRKAADGAGSQSGLRDVMPATAAIIDDLRSAFGTDEIHAAIRDGMQGGERFYASEAGRVIGRPVSLDGRHVVGGKAMVLPLALARKDRKLRD